MDYTLFNRFIIIPLLVIFLTSCVNTPRHYKPAGFNSFDEVKPYISDYLYYALKLDESEWSAFYRKFPEYWKDMKSARKHITIDYHPAYTAYAFNWISLKRQDKWNDETKKRLKSGNLRKGDNIFKVIYSRGVPTRVVWNNEAEVLIYKDNADLIFLEDVFYKEIDCDGCEQKYDYILQKGYEDKDVLKKLKMSGEK